MTLTELKYIIVVTRHPHFGRTDTAIIILSSSINGHIKESNLLLMIAFEHPAPSRRKALAWPSNFTHTSTIEALHDKILQRTLNGVSLLPKEVVN